MHGLEALFEKGWKVKEKGGKVVAKAPTKTRAVRDGAKVVASRSVPP